MRDLDTVSTYLHFGYLPSCQADPAGFLAGLLDGADRHRRSSEDDTTNRVDVGVEALRGAFLDTLNQTDDGKVHVVPLSGGLDSRAILGGLLENLDSGEIQAVTFGTPGTWDYEIGRQVARTFGVRCESMDLTADDWRWSTEDLVQTASAMAQPVWVFDSHVNRQIPLRFGENCVYWSGFMGDPLAGSHLLDEDSATWDEAKNGFVRRNRLARSLKLTPPGIEAGHTLPSMPFVDPGRLCYDEQLDFAIRQQCRIRHLVLPAGYNYQTPFLHPEWSSFILGAAREDRENKALYKEILRAVYPKLMSLPTKENVGLPPGAARWRKILPAGRLYIHAAVKRYAPRLYWGVSPTTNYIDFDRGLRNRVDLKQVVYANLQDLKERDITTWLDIDEIWQRHQNRQSNHADALLLLASLELHCKVGQF